MSKVQRQVVLVFGANTEIGKTVCSIGIVRAGLRRGAVSYLKPVQTGDGDVRMIERYANSARAEALYSWSTPCSPHLAAPKDEAPNDMTFREAVSAWLEKSCEPVSIIETAGGVLSPAPSGTPQAEILKALTQSFSVLLVGDGRLGGISATLTAFEALESRGLRPNALALVGADPQFGNAAYLRSYFADTDLIDLPAPPPMPEPLHSWLSTSAAQFDFALARLLV